MIDDKPANIFSIEKLLEKPGRTFLSSTNGKEGLKLALESEVDLIILDVQMPEMDGFEVAQVLKSHKRTRDIPIIFASAEKKERQSIMKGFEEGAVDYLSKPLDPELTRAKVSVLLKIQMQKKELLEKNESLRQAEARIMQLNADLQKNLAQLEVANKELESFSYSVSHDLRAPLRSVIGYSNILEEDFRDKLGEEGVKTLNTISQNASRMNKLIDDLLEFSRCGKKELHAVTIDSQSMVGKIIRDITETSKHKAVIDVRPLPSVQADDALLAQVWINLISNAIKYSSKSERPAIEIGSETENGETIFYVKDNGAGFNMEFASKLFGVFQRLHKSEEFEGTGIGLSIVKRIVTRHGGRVWAEGKVNEGARFYFSLPA